MSDAPSVHQDIRGQWGPPPPADFLALVAAVTKIGTNVEHITEDVRDHRRSLDQFIVEHRSQHNTDRTITEKQVSAAEASVKESVKEQLSITRKIYVGLLTAIVLLLVADVLARLLA